MTKPPGRPSFLSRPSAGPMTVATPAAHGALVRQESPPAYQDDWILYDNGSGQPPMSFFDSHGVDEELLDVEEPSSLDSNVVVP